MADTAAAFTRRRRATFAAGAGMSLQPMNGRSVAACLGSAVGDSSRDNFPEEKRDRSQDAVQSKSKSDKKKGRSDISDAMR